MYTEYLYFNSIGIEYKRTLKLSNTDLESFR